MSMRRGTLGSTRRCLSVPCSSRMRQSLRNRCASSASEGCPAPDPVGGIPPPTRDCTTLTPAGYAEVDETWIDGPTRGEGRGVHRKTMAACAVENRRRKPDSGRDTRRRSCARSVQLAVMADLNAKSLCHFVERGLFPVELWSSPTNQAPTAVYASVAVTIMPLRNPVALIS